MPESSRSPGGSESPPPSITEMLRAWHGGSEDARDRVFEVTYGELRALAGAYLRRERRRDSIQVTALVHEAFLRLVGTQAPWADRGHFYGVAAQAMRRILVDHARRRRALKRGGPGLVVSLDDAGAIPDPEGCYAIELDEALTDLERLDARQASVVEMRYFGGLSVADTANALGLSAAMVKREAATARAWIARRIHRGRSL